MKHSPASPTTLSQPVNKYYNNKIFLKCPNSADIFVLSNESVKKQTISLEIRPELRSCVKVEMDVLGSPSLINLRFLWT